MTALSRRLSALGRAPVPEWEELARAAAPTPGRIAAWFAHHLLLVLVLPHLALLVALCFRSPVWAAGFWLLAGLADWAVTRADSPASRLLGLAGLTPQLRAALRSLVLLGSFVAAGIPAGVVAYVVAVLVIQLLWTALGALATWLWRSEPPLRYLPGEAGQPEPLAGYALCYARVLGTPWPLVAAELLAAAGVILAGLGLGVALAWVLPAAGVLVVVGYAAWTALDARRLLGRRAADEAALVDDLAGSQPSYLVYVSLGAGQSRYIVNQWLPVFDATPSQGVIVVREASQLKPLATTRLPVVYAPTTRHVERLTLSSIKVAFYLAYGEKNAHLLREPRLRHVMLLHGDSDKATSANAQARAFDQVWVAGQAAVDRYRAAGVDLPDERFALIGRPQVEPLLHAAPHAATTPVVLYAPTFEGYYEQTAHSSLDTMGVAMVRAILAGFPQVSIWFKPHPASGVVRPSMLAAIAEIETLLSTGDHVLVDRTDLSLVDCLARADVLLADVSSVTSDFLATGRPAIITNPAGLDTEDFLAAYPGQRGLYLVSPGLSGFEATLAAAFGDDPLRDQRLALRSYLLGDQPPQAAFDAALARLAAQPSPAAGPDQAASPAT